MGIYMKSRNQLHIGSCVVAAQWRQPLVPLEQIPYG